MSDPRTTAETSLETSHDDVVALHGISWPVFESICDAIGESGSPRVTYFEGELNLMSPGSAHEYTKTLLARLIETFAEVRDIPLNGGGNATFKRKAKKSGLEPDECYSVGHARKIPDFAIEIIITSGTIEKLLVYARLGFPEVWFWECGKISVYALEYERKYKQVKTSRFLRGFPFGKVERILSDTSADQQFKAVRAFRRSLERR